MKSSITPPTLDNKVLSRATVHIEPIQNYAEIFETLHFDAKANDADSPEADLVDAGTESKFIHGMDTRSMVTMFRAKAFFGDQMLSAL